MRGHRDCPGERVTKHISLSSWVYGISTRRQLKLLKMFQQRFFSCCSRSPWCKIPYHMTSVLRLFAPHRTMINLYTSFFCLVSCSLWVCFFVQVHFLILAFTFLEKNIQTVEHMPFLVTKKTFHCTPQPDYANCNNLHNVLVCPMFFPPART